MAFWTCRETATAAANTPESDEYVLVVQGCHTLIIEGERIPVKAGEEYSQLRLLHRVVDLAAPGRYDLTAA